MKSLKKVFFFSVVSILTSGLFAQTSEKSLLSRPDMERLSQAKRFQDIFNKTLEIQLPTFVETAIAHISDMEIDGRGNLLVADG